MAELPSPSRVACDEARSGSVLQGKGAECVWSENTMQFSHHHQLATSLPLHSQSFGRGVLLVSR